MITNLKNWDNSQILKYKERTKMTTGKLKWFDPKKGYGFITPDEGGKDAFLHVSALQAAGIDSIDEGQAVSYELAEQKGKESATNIQKQ